jgi:phosphate transport system permease protein
MRTNTDWINKGLIYLSASISILILSSILWFIVSKGYGKLSWELLISDYQTKNQLAVVETSSVMTFQRPAQLSVEASWSSQYGVGFVDFTSREKARYILVEYIDPQSPLLTYKDKTTGESQQLVPGQAVLRINYRNMKGELDFAGSEVQQNAQQLVEVLDQKVQMIDSMYLQVLGGGIRGALIATLWLIIVSLSVALPIGIGSAIWLNEYGAANKISKLIKTSVDTLSGVPSIVYGLMGVTVFYPLTTKFGANGLSILLGALTMSVILLPTIIKTTQEALKVIPDGLRQASLALGANNSQTIFKVILPSALPGILTGVLLSVGRIIGESAALIYTMGVFVNDSPQVLKPGASLAVQIYAIMSGEQPNFELAAAISLIILLVVFALNIIVKGISYQLRKRWE